MGLTDPAWATTSFLVIDFETVTPTGRRPEPIEVAVAVLRDQHSQLTETGRFETLIRPPADVSLSAFDTAQTGITSTMLDDAPTAAEVMASIEAKLADPPSVLVAHNASYEAGLIYDQRGHCPNLARTPLLDTLRLARAAYPELHRHGLDELLHHLSIPAPADRHRAMPDVQATAHVFAHIVDDGARAGQWHTLADLSRIAGIEPKAVRDDRDAARPHQETLFG